MSRQPSKLMLLALLGLLSLSIGACNKLELQRLQAARTPAAENAPDSAKAQLKMGTHAVTVVPGSEMTAHSEMIRNVGDRRIEHYEFQVGDKHIVIEDEKLFVNEIFYGDLKKGDAVLVDHESVHINGKPVQGEGGGDEDNNDNSPVVPVQQVFKMPKIA